GIERLARVISLFGWIRSGEEGDRGNPQIDGLGHNTGKQIDRDTLDARHRGNRRPLFTSILDEDRPNQVVNRKLTLGNKSTRPVESANPTQTRRRKLTAIECRRRTGHARAFTGVSTVSR